MKGLVSSVIEASSQGQTRELLESSFGGRQSIYDHCSMLIKFPSSTNQCWSCRTEKLKGNIVIKSGRSDKYPTAEMPTRTCHAAESR